MIVRRCAVVALVVTGLLTVAVPTANATTVSPSEWAPSFCTALTEWQSTIQQKSDAMTTELDSVTDLSDARDKIAGFLSDMVGATNDTASAIKDAGNPSSPNGAKISAVFVNGFKAISKLFAKAQSQAQKLPTSSPQKFKVEGKKIGVALTASSDTLGKSFSSIGKLDKGKKLEAAVKAAPECASIA